MKIYTISIKENLMFYNALATLKESLKHFQMLNKTMNTITKKEIINSITPLNNTYFHIDDLDEYAEKITKFGKAIVKRNENNKLISYILYYDNGPDIFISMVWTKQEYQAKGLAKKLIIELIEKSSKEITLEVNKNNPAKYLYKNLKFIEEDKNDENIFMRFPRQLSIMQSYTFPYIGYFNLIEATDKIVFYDNVNYIKRSWINRNKILINNSDFLFTIPVEKASQNKLINEIKPLINPKFIDEFFAQIQTAYKKAPHYNDVIEILKTVLNNQYNDIADLAINSITSVYKYLDKHIQWIKSSTLSQETKEIGRADRLIQITKELGYTKYINAIGGKELYNKNYFKAQGIQLNFIEPQKTEYKQFNNNFVPWLSIIDVLMFNDKKAVKDLFTKYNVV